MQKYNFLRILALMGLCWASIMSAMAIDNVTAPTGEAVRNALRPTETWNRESERSNIWEIFYNGVVTQGDVKWDVMATLRERTSAPAGPEPAPKQFPYEFDFGKNIRRDFAYDRGTGHLRVYYEPKRPVADRTVGTIAAYSHGTFGSRYERNARFCQVDLALLSFTNCPRRELSGPLENTQ